jgi:hypothetical protein
MFEYEKLANRYGASVTVIRGLQFITVPTRAYLKVDVGFGVEKENVFDGSFPLFRRHPFGSNLFFFGDRAIALAQHLPDDDLLCSSLRLVLEQYAYRLDWSEKQLSARINTLQGFPSDDGTGGARLFSAMKTIADHLDAIDIRSFELKAERTGWGPSRIRRIALFCAFALPAVCYVVLRR